ncbi:MAG: 30S ribosomal protein S18 [Candidatus Omnitrophica bacterium]|nr:30S ribosomal protein S18 [Candidatus Omnitrophota bacterium]MBU4589691.1 30S ribosomal protein S18 [Candidatus Omnitrophota bacterium]
MFKEKRGSFRKDKKKGAKKRVFFRKKFCKFCVDKVDTIDYKDILKLKRFVTEKGKILPNRITGNCAKHQRRVAVAIKRARYVALLPYVGE